MGTFFTADLHFGRESMIYRYDRPEKNILRMNDLLVRNWNSVVGRFDLVYIAGDLTDLPVEQTLPYLDRLNGIKHLIIGNHDRNAVLSPDFLSKFATCDFYRRIRVDGYNVILTHKPLEKWEGMDKGYIHLHGHIHDVQVEDANGLIYNVGVDANNYKPISLNDILKKINYRDRILSFIELNQPKTESISINGVSINSAQTLYESMNKCIKRKDTHRLIREYEKHFNNKEDAHENIRNVLKHKKDTRLNELFYKSCIYND